MADLPAQVDQLISHLQAGDTLAQERVQALVEQAQPWEEDKLVVQREIHPILEYWYKRLNAQFSRLSTGNDKVRGLRLATLRANVFTYSVHLHPKVLLKQMEIVLITILSWLKLGLFLLIQLAILAATVALAIVLIYFAIRLGLYLLALLLDLLQSLIQQIQAPF